MPLTGYAKVSGVWRSLTGVGWIKNGGVWRSLDEGASRQWMKVNGQWRTFTGGAPGPGPTPGTYVLQATSISIGTTAFAEFDTAVYRGFISEIRIRLSWKSEFGIDNDDIQTSGRPSGTFYRTIANDNNEWDGRTIDHRIDTFNASSLTEFNNASAIGFNLTNTGPVGSVTRVISNIQLVLTIP